VKKRALVTGGAGFIGSHLSEELLSKGWSVTVIDDLSTSSTSNIEHLSRRKNFTFKKGSILNRRLLSSLVKNCDIVYHLAASVGVEHVIENPLRSLITNVNGTENVLEFCSKHKKKVIITSSSEVYGKGEKISFREDDDRVFGPTSVSRWGYAEAKAIDEFFAKAYFREKGVKIVIVRLFNTSGPRQTGRYGMVIPRFVAQALKGENITVYGHGDQTRCFSHVKDTVKMIYILSVLKKAEGDIFNVGNDKSMTMLELARKIKKKTASRSKIVRVPYEKAYGKFFSNFEDMLSRRPDMTKTRKATGYRSVYDVDDIIDDIIGGDRDARG
jgi:UDP-glucose 4-epimerase